MDDILNRSNPTGLVTSEDPDATGRAVETHRPADGRQASVIANLRILLNTTPDLVVLVDVNGMILETGRVMPDMFNKSAEELIGTNIRQWIPRENLEYRMSVVEQVIKCKESVYFEDMVGERVWRNAVFPILGEDGEITHIALFGHDMTESRKAAESLRMAESQFRDFYDHSPIGLYRTTREGRIILANRAICDMLGYQSFQELAARDLESSGFGETSIRRDFIDRIEKVGEIRDQESVWVRSDGSEIIVRESAKAFRDSSGRTLYYDGYVEDITSDKGRERALNEAEGKFQRLVANLNDVVYSVDGETGEYSYLSPVFEKMFGYSESDLASMGGRVGFLAKVLVDEKASDHEAGLDLLRNKATDGIFNYEYWCRCKDGTLKYIADRWTPVYRNNKLISTDGVLRDITIRKQVEDALGEALERAEASDRLKTAFMNNISHEVRTPLNGILGFADLMDSGDPSAEDRQLYREVLRESSDRLLKTIESYMDISLLVSGNMKTCQSRFDLSDILKQAWLQYKDKAAAKGISLQISLSPGDPQILVESDPAIVNKILVHLLENALKFTEFGLVEISCKRLAGRVEITVRDSGPGIEEQIQNQIFDSFLQADASNTRKHEGSGLGLAIVKGLVDLIGGTVWVKSALGKGSTFGFTIPDKEVEALFVIEPLPSKVKAVDEGPVILIAEDDAINIFLLETMLGKTRAIVWHVENGSLAVDFCRHHPEVTLVLMDLKMPVMDGFDATRRIKEFRPELPVLAVTAFAMPGDKEAAMASGCDGYMSKPFTSAQLLEQIRRFTDL